MAFALLDPLLRYFTLTDGISSAFSVCLKPLARKVEPHLRSQGPGYALKALIAMMTGVPRRPSLRWRATWYTYHVNAVDSLRSINRVKRPRWMGTAETEGEKRATSHLEQQKRGCTRCRAERRLRREVSADTEPAQKNEGEGVDS